MLWLCWPIFKVTRDVEKQFQLCFPVLSKSRRLLVLLPKGDTTCFTLKWKYDVLAWTGGKLWKGGSHWALQEIVCYVIHVFPITINAIIIIIIIDLFSLFIQNEARKLNNREASVEEERNKRPVNWEAKRKRSEWEEQQDQLKKVWTCS